VRKPPVKGKSACPGGSPSARRYRLPGTRSIGRCRLQQQPRSVAVNSQSAQVYASCPSPSSAPFRPVSLIRTGTKMAGHSSSTSEVLPEIRVPSLVSQHVAIGPSVVDRGTVDPEVPSMDEEHSDLRR